MEKYLIYNGKQHRVYVIGSDVLEFIAGLEEREKKVIRRRIRSIGDGGKAPGGRMNTQHIHTTGAGNVLALKTGGGIRLPFIEDQREVVIIDGVKKKQDNYKRSERDRFASRRDAYINNRNRYRIVPSEGTLP